MLRERIIEVKKYTGKKERNEKLYTWEYYNLNVSVYLSKSWIERFGTKYKMTIDDEKGTILIEPAQKVN